MRLLNSFGLLIAVAVPAGAAAAQQQQPRPATPQDIIVTGIRIQDYRDRLAQCLARNCPTDEDADATLALAEALFLNGDYADGLGAVRASIARNRGQARAYPEPVSELYRAGTRLSRHIGYDREARTLAFGILNALRAGIAREDHRHFTARFEIAEIQMMSGNTAGARRELMRLARIARAAGREDVATSAELRDLWYELVAFPGSDARSRLIEWTRLTAPGQRMRAIGARILLSRIYRQEGKADRADALLAEVGAAGLDSPRRRLLHAPFYQLYQYETTRIGNVLNRLTENYEGRWIDVGFWILPDGHVSGVDIVRQGATTDWAAPLLGSIRGRLYSAGSEPVYRLERYTMTAGFEAVTGTRFRRRAPGARAEYLDLTENPPSAPAAAPLSREGPIEPD